MSDDVMQDTSMLSLADLADVDVSGVKELRFEAIPEGTVDFKITEQAVTADTKDGVRVFRARIKFTALEYVSVLEVPPGLSSEEYRESLKGKAHTWMAAINMSDDAVKQAEAIGRIRALHTDVGLAESHPWGANLLANVASFQDVIVRATVKHRPNKQNPDSPFVEFKFNKAA